MMNADSIVACSGIEGSNASEASRKLFPNGNILHESSFADVFESVRDGKCEYGVLPIENSFNGSVREVYNLLTKHKFFIVKSLLLPIRHCLLAKKGTAMNEINTVYSHPQALGQCSRFLSSMSVHGTKSIPFWNTAAAAKMVSETDEPGIAAIASLPCAELYGLGVLASDIQDSSDNYTKFVCVAKNPAVYEGADHISIIAGCKNEPGALEAVLSKISARGVNMNKIESCPKSGFMFEYIFFIELEASLNDKGIAEMLDDVEKSCADFTFLGNYELIGGIKS